MFRGCFEAKVPSNNKTGTREHMHEAYRFMQYNILTANWKYKNLLLFFVDEFETIWFVYFRIAFQNLIMKHTHMTIFRPSSLSHLHEHFDREKAWIYESHLLCTSLTVLSIELEDSLRKSLKKGKFDDITDKITPRTLTKCNTNALLMAMEVSLTPDPVINALILPNMLF